MVDDQEIARFDVVEEGGASKQSGANRGFRVQASAGLPQGREAQVMGLPWLTLSAPRAWSELGADWPPLSRASGSGSGIRSWS